MYIVHYYKQNLYITIYISDEFLNNEKNFTEYAVHGHNEFSMLIFYQDQKRKKSNVKVVFSLKQNIVQLPTNPLDCITKGKLKDSDLID